MGKVHAWASRLLLISLIAATGSTVAGCSTRKRIATPDADPNTTSVVLENPDVEAADARVEQAIASHDRTGIGLFPEFSVGTNIIDSSTSRINRQSSDRSSNFAAFNLPITDILSRANLLKGADARLKAAVSGYNEATQSALQETANAIAETRQQTQLVEARKTNLSDLRAFYSKSKRRQQAGSISKADLQQVRLSVANAEATLSNAKASRQAAVARKMALLAGNPEIDVDFAKLKPHLPTSLEHALEIAAKYNPKLRRLAWSKNEAERNIAAARIRVLPSASLSATGNRYLDSGRTVFGDDSDVRVKFSLSVPLTKTAAQREVVRRKRQNSGKPTI